jgi:DNA polymerase V
MPQTAHLSGQDPIVIAKRIQREIYDTTGISASIGIGPNLFLSKIALDVESKHSNSRIAMWTYEDVSKKLWGIGTATEEVLHGMGLFSLKDVAKTPKELLIKRFGKVKGEESYHFLYGIDESQIANKYILKSISITKGQISLEDCFSHNKLNRLLLEQIEEACFRLRSFAMIYNYNSNFRISSVLRPVNFAISSNGIPFLCIPRINWIFPCLIPSSNPSSRA